MGGTPERIKSLIAILKGRFPTREGFKVSISIDRQEHDYYEDANEYVRKCCPGPYYTEE